MATFKDLIKTGAVKRADAMQVRLADIHEEPGFNLRAEGDELEASIDALAKHIADGGTYPPLEVRPREEGGVWVVDGHRRRRALERCLVRGVPLANPKDGAVWVHVVAFVGNDADRVARVITSAEGRSLTGLEVAAGLKRLVAFGWTPEQIAKKIGKTDVHVRNLLVLANANSDVLGMVSRNEVSASVAAQVVRKHGDSAGQLLGAELDKAKAAGKAKVMPKAMAPKTPAVSAPVGSALLWTPTVAALPDSDVTVLIWLDSDDWYAGWYDDNKSCWIDASTGGTVDGRVTHFAHPEGPRA